MRTRSNLSIALVLAIGLLLAWTGIQVWAAEKVPPAGSATGTPPLHGNRLPSVTIQGRGVIGTSVVTLTTIPARLAPGQVPPPTFEAGRAVPNAPWSTNTLLATDTNAAGYSPPDGGITVNGNNVFVSMNYFPNNPALGWEISRSTDRGVTWLPPYQWASNAGGDPTPYAGGRDTTYLIEFNGGFNGFQWTRTTNGGTSWSAPATVVNESGLDKELMAIDTVNTNYLYLQWVNFGASWGDIHFSRSTDKGTTWSTPVVINDGAGTGYRTGSAPWVGRGPYSGHVYCVWQDDRLGGDGRICMKKSTDHGATWTAGSEITVANIHLVTAHSTISNWRRPMHAYPANHPRPFPAVGTDSQGRIFVSYCSAPTAGSTRNYDPMVTVSTDEGATWSTPVSANMAASGDTADQYLPWLWVDPSDVVHVFWCDMRNYNNLNGDIYYSYSMNHGATFSPPEMINDVTPCLYGSVAANYQGDYNMICADMGRVYAEWCDNRSRGGNWQDVEVASRTFSTSGPNIWLSGFSYSPAPMPGATVAVVDTLTNTGTMALNNTQGTLRTSSPYAHLIDSTYAFGTIGVGSKVDNGSSPFHFTVDPGTPYNTSAPFDLHIVGDTTGGQYITDLPFDILLNPHLPDTTGTDFYIMGDGDNGSGTAVSTALYNLGYKGKFYNNKTFVGYPAIAPYRSVWIFVPALNGSDTTYPLMHTGSSDETQMVNYLNAGGRMYFQHPDLGWACDPAGGIELQNLYPMFHIGSYSDYSGNMAREVGTTGHFAQGMDFAYNPADTGANNGNDIDPLTPGTGAFALFTSQTGGENHMIAYDSGTYRSLASTLVFVGLTDSMPPSTQQVLADSIMHWFGIYEGVEQGGGNAKLLPRSYELGMARPNPMSQKTAISFALPRDSRITLKVYNLAGQLVTTLVDGKLPAGYHEARWDGRGLSSGVYFYRLEAGTFTATRKLVLVR